MPDADPATGASALPPIWRQRNYMLLWSGQVVSSLGSGMTAFALPLLILAITGSPLVAGVASALYWLPYPLFSLPAGALMDRWDRKRVMIVCDAVRAVNIATVPLAIAAGRLTIPQIYGNAFVEGTCFVLFNIAEVAALSRVVDKSQLPYAAAQNEAAFGLVGLVSPSLGGFLYKAVSPAFPFLVDAISYAASVVTLSRIDIEFQTERKLEPLALRRSIAEGLRWLWSRRLIRTMAFLTGASNLVFTGSTLAILILAREHGADPGTIGVMFSISAAGGVLGAIVSGPISRRLSFAQAILGTVWVTAAAFPLLLVAPNVFVIGAVNAVIYATVPLYNVVQFSYRLALIPDELQGRVNSAFRLLALGSQPLGAALAGVLLERLGAHTTIAIFAAAYLVLGVLASASRPIRTARPIAEVRSEP
jgi:predicted MFS family arabinose efflux permease